MQGNGLSLKYVERRNSRGKVKDGERVVCWYGDMD